MPEDVEDVETRLSEYKDDKVSEAQSAAEDVRDAAESFFKEDSNGKAERAEAAVVDFKDGAGDLQQSAEEGIEHYAQMAEQSAEDVAQRIQDAASHAQSAFDDGLSVASDAVKSGAAQARFQYSRTQERAQGIYKSAELKAGQLTQNIKSHTAEAQKLEERLAAAQSQYTAGLNKVIATNRQLKSLQNEVYRTEKGATSVLEALRELPSSHALKLRAEVAMSLAAAKAQKAALERQIYKLSSKGF